jgi:hypothetical protein
LAVPTQSQSLMCKQTKWRPGLRPEHCRGGLAIATLD